jgi:hypothetical protein
MMAFHRCIDQTRSNSRDGGRELVTLYSRRERGHGNDNVVLCQMSRLGSDRLGHNMGRGPPRRILVVFK